MTRPKETLAELMAGNTILQDAKLADYPVWIIGVRGYYKKTMGDPTKNDRGMYDDAIFLVSRERVFMACNGNTDPSRFTPGVATLVPGIHLYKRGLHGISRDHPYPAFRPASEDECVPVTRDGQKGTSRGIAINIHKGGYNTTSSLGCQTVHPDQWDEFQRKAYQEMDFWKQKQVPYILVEN